MKGQIDRATLADTPHFYQLWWEYLVEQRKEGSKTHDSYKNLATSYRLFHAYVTGTLSGVVRFWRPEPGAEPGGVLLVGEHWGGQADFWETDLGRLAIVWGVYVSPQFRGLGVGIAMEKDGMPEAEKLFDTLETVVRTDNPYGQKIADGVDCNPVYVTRRIYFREDSP